MRKQVVLPTTLGYGCSCFTTSLNDADTCIKGDSVAQHESFNVIACNWWYVVPFLNISI